MEGQGSQSILSFIPQRFSQFHQNKSIKALYTDPQICLLLASLLPVHRHPSQIVVFLVIALSELVQTCLSHLIFDFTTSFVRSLSGIHLDPLYVCFQHSQ